MINGTHKSKEEGKRDGVVSGGKQAAPDMGPFMDVKEQGQIYQTKIPCSTVTDIHPIAMRKNGPEEGSGKPPTSKQTPKLHAKVAELLSTLRRIPALGIEYSLSLGKVRIRWTCVSGIVMHDFYSFLAHSLPQANYACADIHPALWSSSLR